MIFTVLNKHSRKHLGIVNEPTIRAAMESAHKRFSYVWDDFTQRLLPAIPIDIEPGETQLGMEIE